jgi:hypothetical protein
VVVNFRASGVADWTRAERTETTGMGVRRDGGAPTVRRRRTVGLARSRAGSQPPRGRVPSAPRPLHDRRGRAGGEAPLQRKLPSPAAGPSLASSAAGVGPVADWTRAERTDTTGMGPVWFAENVGK